MNLVINITEIQHIGCIITIKKENLVKIHFKNVLNGKHLSLKQKFLSKILIKRKKWAKKRVWNVLNVHLGHIISEKTP